MRHVIELIDYALAPQGSGKGIQGFYFGLSPGDVCAVEAANPDDGRLFLRALASLILPLQGTYKFAGRRKNTANYRDMLECKQQIGYIAPDAALISNLSLRQNLLLRRFYLEDSLTIELEENDRSLCEKFDILDKLNIRPARLNSMELQAAIVIREISKKPRVLLLDRPEDFIGHARFDLLVSIFNDLIAQDLPVVFFSYDRRLVRRFANRKISITNGTLSTVAVKKDISDESIGV